MIITCRCIRSLRFEPNKPHVPLAKGSLHMGLHAVLAPRVKTAAFRSHQKILSLLAEREKWVALCGLNFRRIIRGIPLVMQEGSEAR